MPELPEVETIVRGLRAVLPGRRILSVRLNKTDFIDDPAALERELPGCRIAAVERHGKFIAVRLERDDAQPSLLIHLGMTGQLAVMRPEQPLPPHTHVVLSLDDGRELRYTDARRFGRMRLAATPAGEAVLGKLGDDPLEITLASFRARLQGRRAMVKALLLDQHFLRGMGNIYTDEALWRARIHPKRHAARLSRDEARRLHSAMRKVLTDAIRLRGSSISDYVDAAGQPGDYQRRHRVYGRDGKECFRCARKIHRIIVAGRSSYFCPRCQKPRRAEVRKSHSSSPPLSQSKEFHTRKSKLASRSR
jgi:formamidopyrimidine-DNA glycosylase